MKHIRIIAPASPVYEDIKNIVVGFFKDLGYQASFSKNAFKHDRFLAGSDAERAADFNDAFADKSVDIVFAFKGAYGSPRILDKINYDLVRENPKPFFGHSDITALQLALYSQTGLRSVTGFNANFAAQTLYPQTIQTLTDCLDEKTQHFKDLTTVVGGKASGTIIGGTMTLINALLGTPYLPDFTGAILVLEDVGDEPYRMDRYLNQLRLAGVFDQVGAVVLGSFYKCIAKDPMDGTMDEILADYFNNLKIPVVTDFPYGHHPDHICYTQGAFAELDAGAGTLTIHPKGHQ